MPYAFEGAHFDFDKHQLNDNPTLAAHFIHSITMMRYNQGKLNYNKSMTIVELFEGNKSFFDGVKFKYKNERRYDIELKSLVKGLEWFLKGVNPT